MKVTRRHLVWGPALATIATVAAGEIFFAAAVAAASTNDTSRAQVMIAFKPGAAAAARSAVAKAGGRVVADLSEVNGLAIELPAAAVRQLQQHASIEFVEDDAPRHAFAKTSAGTNGAAQSPAQTVPYGISMVQADRVSDAFASDRKLCIVDSGIDASHEDLQGIAMDGDNLSKSGEWFTDESGHGTHVAGTIAAVDNAIGVIGVLPNRQVRLHIAKVFDVSGSASTSTIIRGMIACMRANANVVSMSLGGDVPSQLEQRITNLLASRDMLLIAAAGNSGNGAVSYPAGYATVVSVAAVDQNMAAAEFSQFNLDVELAGPGVNVLSTIPMGTGIDVALTVGGTPYFALPTEGTPVASASAPLADFGLGDTAASGSMTGKMCLIQRGSVSFATKVLNCEASGGAGAIIYNNVAGAVIAILGGAVTTFPSVTVTQADGTAMLGQLGQTVALTLTPSSYAAFDGTSMATPHVSGVAALVWSYHPACTAEQVRVTLDKSALDLGAPRRDDHFGFGLVQAKAAFDRIAALGCGN